MLGRAIEPPQLDSIAMAIRSLQDCGAITIQDKKNGSNTDDTGEITFLGKIYCDLPCEVKISKLILFGKIFQVMEEAITLASILSQRKSIFRPDSREFPRNRYNYIS